MSAINLAKNHVYHARMKHIAVIFYFVKEILEEGDLVLEKIHTKNNLADILTKMVSGAKFNQCKKLLYILPIT